MDNENTAIEQQPEVANKNEWRKHIDFSKREMCFCPICGSKHIKQKKPKTVA